MTNRTDLDALLQKLATNGGARIEGYVDWMLSRGFPENYVFWNFAVPEADAEYSVYANMALISMAGNGDIGAMHSLAERRLSDDPLDALVWYDQAIASGSLYAMLKTTDLLEMIIDPQIQALFDKPEWQRALEALNRDAIAPKEKALAWAVAAVIVGGYGIVDHKHAGRLTRLSSQLAPDAVRRACETAQTYVLDSAAAIRASGGTVFSLDQPPLALTVPTPESLVPCDSEVQPLIDLMDCDAHPVLAPNQAKATLWICPYADT
jgi:hypothetical protein